MTIEEAMPSHHQKGAACHEKPQGTRRIRRTGGNGEATEPKTGPEDEDVSNNASWNGQMD